MSQRSFLKLRRIHFAWVAVAGLTGAFRLEMATLGWHAWLIPTVVGLLLGYLGLYALALACWPAPSQVIAAAVLRWPCESRPMGPSEKGMLDLVVLWLVRLCRPAYMALLLAVVITVPPAYVYFVPTSFEACNESQLYRIEFRIRACDHNDEAADDFYCHETIGGLREFLLQRELTQEECGKREADYFVPTVERIAQLGRPF